MKRPLSTGSIDKYGATVALWYRPLKGLIGERKFTVLNMEKNSVI